MRCQSLTLCRFSCVPGALEWKSSFTKSPVQAEGLRFLPQAGVPEKPLDQLIPKQFIRAKQPALPEVSELETMRHFVRLSYLNHNIDKGFYPLGSCTMKYNPKVNDAMAALEGFRDLHPYQPDDQIQGALELLWNLQNAIANIVGLPAVTLQPAAGAHGEMTGLLIIKAYFDSVGDKKRNKVIVPDTAHGTNPATAAIAGFEVVEIKSNNRGLVDIDALKAALGPDTAAIMLTNPNTLGLFEEEIRVAQKLVHEAGGLLYYDGANLNAIMGLVRPGDMGFDVCHLNLHKTFSTPHGGGGPGGCAVAVRANLEPFLPKPVVARDGDRYFMDWERPQSIGKVKGFYGNFGILVRAYSYILAHGKEGLCQVSRDAILSANYLKERMKEHYVVAYPQACMHEFVLSGTRQKETRRIHCAHRQADARLRCARADRLLPARSAGSDDDRADRDRVERDAGRIRCDHAQDRRGVQKRSRPRAQRTAYDTSRQTG